MFWKNYRLLRRSLKACGRWDCLLIAYDTRDIGDLAPLMSIINRMHSFR